MRPSGAISMRSSAVMLPTSTPQMRADLTLTLALMMPEFSMNSALDDEISASMRPLTIRSSSLLSLPLMTIVGPIAVVVALACPFPFSPLAISRHPSRCCP